MADSDFDGLTPLTSAAAADILGIEDDSANETKGITISDLFGATTPIVVQIIAGANGIRVANDGGLVLEQGSLSGATAQSAANDFVINGNGNVGISMLAGASSVCRIAGGDSASNDVWRVEYNNSDDSMRFRINSAERLRVTSTGALDIFDGLRFDSGDLLDEYVGRTSWTPVLEFGGTDVDDTGSYARQDGYYVRIGPLVIFQCRIELSSKGTDTGIATISGLPVNEVATSNLNGPAYFSRLDDINMYAFMGAYVQTDQIVLVRSEDDNPQASLTDADFEDTTDMELGGFYFAA